MLLIIDFLFLILELMVLFNLQKLDINVSLPVSDPNHSTITTPLLTISIIK